MLREILKYQASTGQILCNFPSIGFAAQEIAIGQESTISVSLLTQQETLSDVVVVGYATQRKANLTGSVSTVDVKKTLGGRPIADVGRGLQGAASGLSVTIPSGEVGSDPIIKIRGQLGSLQGGSSSFDIIG